MSYSRTEYAKFNILYGYLRKIILIFLEFFCRVVFITTLGEDLLGVNSVFINIIQILSLTELGMTNVVTSHLDGTTIENTVLFYL